MKNRLSILIATTIDRRNLFHILYETFTSMIKKFKYDDLVEIVFLEDNKEISIGLKRQKLLEQSKNEYIVYFDSDDMPREAYLPKIITAIQENPDCVGFLINMTTNGQNNQTCCHSLKYKVWSERQDGYDYVRNVTHFNPVKRELAIQVGFQDLRYGEDKLYADALTNLCSKEVFINEFLFDYRYSNHISHNEKYGIK